MSVETRQKPYSLVGEPDAAMTAKIDEMFDILFSDVDFVATSGSHELLSDTHSDSEEASVSRGSLIVGQRIGTSSDVAWQELTIGATTLFLKSDGVDAAWGAVNESDIVDGSLLARVAANEDITGSWAFAEDVVIETGNYLRGGSLSVASSRLIGYSGTTVFVGDAVANNNTAVDIYTAFARRMNITGTAIDFTVPQRGASGSASAPTYSHTTDTNTGMYFANNDTVLFSAGGTLRMTLSSTGLGIGITPTVKLDVVNAGLALVATPTVRLVNDTAATSIATRQFSPALTMSGTAWDTSGAGSSVTQRIALYMRTLSGSDTGGLLAIADDSNGAGTLTDQFYVGSAITGGSPDFRIRDGNIVFRNAGRGIGFVTAPLTDAIGSSVFSGDVVGGTFQRLKFTTTPGWVFIEGNNFGTGAGVNPMMDFRGFDDSVSSPIVQIRMRGTPGGTVANGFGSRLLYQANSSTTADQNQGSLDVVWSDVTHASRTGAFVVSLVNNAAANAEKLRVTGPGLLTFGGVTSSQPALKPNSAVLETKLADDSAYAQHKALEFMGARANFLMRNSVAWSDGAAAGAGTLTNAPTAGDPTKWIPVDDNGTTRYIPAW